MISTPAFQPEGLGFDKLAQGLSWLFLCVYGFSAFFPLSKNMHSVFIGGSKLPISVNVSVHGPGDLSELYPTLRPTPQLAPN